MAAEFSKAVELGLQLTKRIYYGKDAAAPAPPRTETMTAEPECYLPTAPMVYAEITDPGAVDNPDVPSYQPYVHGRYDPPAMIPLHMHGVSVEADCCLDTAFVTVRGAWRVHCVSASRSCCCRIAVPMGEQSMADNRIINNVWPPLNGRGGGAVSENIDDNRLFFMVWIIQECSSFHIN